MKNKPKTTRQRLLIGAAAGTALVVLMSFLLAFLGKGENAEVTVTVIGMFGTIFAGYMAADCVDHNSANKYTARKNHEGDEE